MQRLVQGEGSGETDLFQCFRIYLLPAMKLLLCSLSEGVRKVHGVSGKLWMLVMIREL